MNLSIVCPTIGRETLARTLESLAPQLAAEDEVLVVADGHQPEVYELCARYGHQFRYLTCYEAGSGWGQAQRNFGMDLAAKDYLAFIGDDDVFAPGALEAIRQAIAAWPGSLFLFRVDTWSSGIVWKPGRQQIEEGYVDASCAVFPNDPERLGRWAYCYTGDCTFIRETAACYPASALVWRPEVIAICRPERYAVPSRALVGVP